MKTVEPGTNNHIHSTGSFLLAVGVWALLLPASAFGFEGRITATLSRGTETQRWLYTVSSNQMRLERLETDRPYAWNLLNLQSGELTLVFPHNRSFVRLKPESAQPPPLPAGLPPGIGPQTTPGAAAPSTIGPTNLSGAPAPPMPAMSTLPQAPADLPPGIGPQAGIGPGVAGGLPPMPPMPMMDEPLELKTTGQTTNLLGYPCVGYELKRRGEVMEIWATDKLVTFQPWLANQPARFGPRMLEEQWGELLRAKKLFPLLAVLKFEHGPERLRFEVKSIKAEKLEDREGTLFQPPPDYHELRPLPF